VLSEIAKPAHVRRDRQGHGQGHVCHGPESAVGGQNASFQRKALAKLAWLVVRDLFETETARFWKDSPQIRGGGKLKCYVYFDPAADGGLDAQDNPITGKWVGLDVPDFPTTKRPVRH
jgi:hypothetical protein